MRRWPIFLGLAVLICAGVFLLVRPPARATLDFLESASAIAIDPEDIKAAQKFSGATPEAYAIEADWNEFLAKAAEELRPMGFEVDGMLAMKATTFTMAQTSALKPGVPDQVFFHRDVKMRPGDSRFVLTQGPRKEEGWITVELHLQDRPSLLGRFVKWVGLGD